MELNLTFMANRANSPNVNKPPHIHLYPLAYTHKNTDKTNKTDKMYAAICLLIASALALPASKQETTELKFGEWKNCGDASKDAYAVQDVYVSQYMGTASIHVFGKVNKEISSGSTLLSALTMGKWPISVQKVDFCDFLENQPIAPKCPLKAGQLNMTLQLSIPANMPPASYSLQSVIQDGDENPIACLQGGFSVPAF